jgi:hypothetical protein
MDWQSFPSEILVALIGRGHSGFIYFGSQIFLELFVSILNQIVPILNIMHCSMSSGDVPIGMDDRFW